MTGLFITFEGIEGCGKSTQTACLQEFLEARGCAVEVTREPGGTALGEAIRKILLNPSYNGMDPTAELLLYEAARAQHVAQRIRPALEQGVIVLCDRFSDSTTAYQGAGRGLPQAELEKLHHLAAGGLLPHLTFVIDVPVEVGLSRASRNRPLDRIEGESRAFHERVRQGFLSLGQMAEARVRIVPGDREEQAIARDVQDLVLPLLDGPRRTP